jgi:hypothetical protein
MYRFLLACTLLLASAASSVHAAPPRGPRAGGPVYISSCAVMFGVRSSGISSTRAGIFGNTDPDKRRIDTEIQRIYRLTGVDTATFQRITDTLCGEAPATLTAAGYRVLSDSARTHFIWAEKDSAGQTSPQDQKLGQTQYLVFAPKGSVIGNPMVVGGLKGGKIQGWDVTIGKQLGLRPVTILYTVDFASVDALQRNRFIGQQWAQVTAKLAVTVGATITSPDVSEAKCSKGAPFGKYKNKEFCLGKTKMFEEGTYMTAEEEEKAFTDPITAVTESTSGGQKMAEAVAGLTNALSGALGQRSGKTLDIDQFDVTMDTAKYEARVLEGAKGALTAAMAAIERAGTKKK